MPFWKNHGTIRKNLSEGGLFYMNILSVIFDVIANTDRMFFACIGLFVPIIITLSITNKNLSITVNKLHQDNEKLCKDNEKLRKDNEKIENEKIKITEKMRQQSANEKLQLTEQNRTERSQLLKYLADKDKRVQKLENDIKIGILRNDLIQIFNQRKVSLLEANKLPFKEQESAKILIEYTMNTQLDIIHKREREHAYEVYGIIETLKTTDRKAIDETNKHFYELFNNITPIAKTKATGNVVDFKDIKAKSN